MKPPLKLRIFVSVAYFLVGGGHLQLAESVTFTKLPANPTKAIKGATASLPWEYEFMKSEKLIYIEFTDIIKGSSADLADINSHGVINVYRTPNMSLTATKNSAVLSIHGITRSHLATYCCKIVTSQTSEKKCIRLEVLVPPKLDVSPTDETVNETVSLDLFCNATGIPAPNVSWTKVGSHKQFSRKERLVIDLARKEDSGTYMCTASNEAGNVTAISFVEVQYKPRNTSLLSSAVMNTVKVDNYVTFNCSTDANPPAQVFSLYHEGSLIAQNSSFTIERVTRSDQGEYTCIPSNNLGEGQNAFTVLTVLVPTTPTEVPEKKTPKPHWLIVAGPIFGGFIVLLLIVVAIVWIMWQKKGRDTQRRTREALDEGDGIEIQPIMNA